jgi:hypothetical protein
MGNSNKKCTAEKQMMVILSSSSDRSAQRTCQHTYYATTVSAEPNA